MARPPPRAASLPQPLDLFGSRLWRHSFGHPPFPTFGPSSAASSSVQIAGRWALKLTTVSTYLWKVGKFETKFKIFPQLLRCSEFWTCVNFSNLDGTFSLRSFRQFYERSRFPRDHSTMYFMYRDRYIAAGWKSCQGGGQRVAGWYWSPLYYNPYRKHPNFPHKPFHFNPSAAL